MLNKSKYIGNYFSIQSFLVTFANENLTFTIYSDFEINSKYNATNYENKVDS
jgi:hypothetical protein